MIKCEKEISNGFDKLLDLVVDYENDPFVLVFDDGSITAEFITMFESDNSFLYEEDDPRYEEFNAIVFKNVNTGEELELTYKDMPNEVWHMGERIL